MLQLNECHWVERKSASGSLKSALKGRRFTVILKFKWDKADGVRKMKERALEQDIMVTELKTVRKFTVIQTL